MTWSFILNSIFLGAGLAMDAFSVSLANGLNEPGMSFPRSASIAGVYAFFQALMPMTGWLCVRRMVHAFERLIPLIPWIALFFLLFIGGNMLWDGLHSRQEEVECVALSTTSLLIQGLATSIDALSVGFTTASYPLSMALLSALIIAAVTFIICLCGVRLGRRVGTFFSAKAMLLGGVILIAVGVEIWAKNVL